MSEVYDYFREKLSAFDAEEWEDDLIDVLYAIKDCLDELYFYVKDLKGKSDRKVCPECHNPVDFLLDMDGRTCCSLCYWIEKPGKDKDTRENLERRIKEARDGEMIICSDDELRIMKEAAIDKGQEIADQNNERFHSSVAEQVKSDNGGTFDGLPPIDPSTSWHKNYTASYKEKDVNLTDVFVALDVVMDKAGIGYATRNVILNDLKRVLECKGDKQCQQ